MEKVDLVIVGAEGVVENGGIINKVGTVTIPRSPSSLNKTLVGLLLWRLVLVNLVSGICIYIQ